MKFEVGDEVTWAHSAPNALFFIEAVRDDGCVIVEDEGKWTPSVHFRRVTPEVRHWHEAIVAFYTATAARRAATSASLGQLDVVAARRANAAWIDAAQHELEARITVALADGTAVQPGGWSLL